MSLGPNAPLPGTGTPIAPLIFIGRKIFGSFRRESKPSITQVFGRTKGAQILGGIFRKAGIRPTAPINPVSGAPVGSAADIAIRGRPASIADWWKWELERMERPKRKRGRKARRVKLKLPRALRGLGSLGRFLGPLGVLWNILTPSEITPEVPIPKLPTGPRRQAIRRLLESAGSGGLIPPIRPTPGISPAAGRGSPAARSARGLPALPPVVSTPAGMPNVPAGLPPSRRPTASGVLTWPLPSPAPPPRLPSIPPVLQQVVGYGLASLLLPSSQLNLTRLQAPELGLQPSSSPLPSAVPYAGSSGTCECKPQRQRRKKSRRTVCYRGTYTETSTGLTKRRKEKIPCRSSRKK